MRRFGPTALLILAAAMPALGAELPSRKAGLWEMKSTSFGVPVTVKQCVDLSTDQTMQSSQGASAQGACSKRDVLRSNNTITVDSTCTFGGKPLTSRMVITGSFDSDYTMTMTMEGDALPGGKKTTTTAAKWLGPCAADLKPGDVIMDDGVKMNILDMQKRAAGGGR